MRHHLISPGVLLGCPTALRMVASVAAILSGATAEARILDQERDNQRLYFARVYAAQIDDRRLTAILKSIQFGAIVTTSCGRYRQA